MIVTQKNAMKVTRDTSLSDLMDKLHRMQYGMIILWVHGGRIRKFAEVDKPAPIGKILAREEKRAKTVDAGN
jgi:hypothetical protein